MCLLHLLYRYGKQSAGTLAGELQVSPRSVNRYVSELNKEIASLFHINNLIQLNNGAEYAINAHLDTPETVEVFYKLKLHYLKQSPHFQLLVFLTTSYKLSVADLSDRLFISSSYLYRLIKETNLFLAPLHLSIEQTKDKQVHISGDELCIRLFSFLFLSDAYQSIEWPFTHVSKEYIFYLLPAHIAKSLAKISSMKKRLICYLYAIIDLRIKNGWFLSTETHGEQNEILALMLKYQRLPIDISHLFSKKAKKENFQTEEAYFHFFVGMFISDFIPLEERQKTARKLWEIETETTNFAKELTLTIHKSENLNLPTDKLQLFFYHVVLFYGFLAEIKEDVTPFWNLLFPCPYAWMKSQPESQHFYPLIKEMMTRDWPFKEENICYLCGVIHTLCQFVKDPALKIYLQITKDFMGEVFVQEKLMEVFNPANIRITDDVREADLVISDSYEQGNKKSRLFFIEDMHDESQWTALFTLTQSLIMAQIF